jgi:hypothetical protein
MADGRRRRMRCRLSGCGRWYCALDVQEIVEAILAA